MKYRISILGKSGYKEFRTFVEAALVIKGHVAYTHASMPSDKNVSILYNGRNPVAAIQEIIT